MTSLSHKYHEGHRSLGSSCLQGVNADYLTLPRQVLHEYASIPKQRMEDTGVISGIIEQDLIPHRWAPPTVSPNNHTTDPVAFRGAVPSQERDTLPQHRADPPLPELSSGVSVHSIRASAGELPEGFT